MGIDAKHLREHVESLKGWIDHWQQDVELNLVPTQESLRLAKLRADLALGLLDRIEAKPAKAA